LPYRYFLFFQYKEAEELLQAHDWALFRQFMAAKDAEQGYVEAMSRPGALTSGENPHRVDCITGNQSLKVQVYN
jgi:hypothetical protein